MSFSPIRKPEGVTAGSMYVLAVLLAFAAIGIQSTIPAAVSSPERTGVQVELTSTGILPAEVAVLGVQNVEESSLVAAVGSVGLIEADNNSPTPFSISGQSSVNPNGAQSNSGEQRAEKLGMDAVLSLRDVQGQNIVSAYFEVCSPGLSDSLRNDRTTKVQQLIEAAKKRKISLGDFGSFTGTQNRCIRENDTAEAKLVPNPAIAWPQWTIYCQPKVPTTAKKSNGDLVEQVVKEFEDVQNFDCKVLRPGEKVPAASGPVTTPKTDAQKLAEEIAAGDKTTSDIDRLTPDQKDDLASAVIGKEASLNQDKQKLLDERKNTVDMLEKIAKNGDPGVCNEAGAAGSSCKTQLENRLKEIDTQIAEKNKQLANLASAKYSLDPNKNKLPGNRQDNSGGPAADDGYVGNDSRFGTPGGGVPSPLGGACTQGYVCSGNTLYYQALAPQMVSRDPMVVQERCMVQPVQQCQFGCQKPESEGGRGKDGGFLTGLMQGLQIFSAISGSFGGGNADMGAPSSRSCATKPQDDKNKDKSCKESPEQPDASQCSAGTWRPKMQEGCRVGWQCVPDGRSNKQPSARISCQPKVADAGSPISISYSCGNSTTSEGHGFDTDGELSGSATTSASKTIGGQDVTTYALTCSNEGITTTAECKVELESSKIVLVTNPQTVDGGETAVIGWVTSGMKSCVISSPDQADFTSANANNTSVNGTAVTSPIMRQTQFRLTCITLAGNEREAAATILIGQQ